MREIRYTILVTAIALLSTYLLIIAFDGVGELIYHIEVATVAPLLITPPFTFLNIHRKIQVETLNKRLNYLLSHDHLTGVATRARLMEAFDQAPGTGALLLIDADKFKELNDIHGHVTGDEALRYLADIMRGVVRKRDIVARWGGEEFVILLREARIEEAVGISDRLISTLNAQGLQTAAGEIQVTVSIGVTLCEPHEKLETVIDRADTALYQAKLGGRNRFVFADWPDDVAPSEPRPQQGEFRRFTIAPTV